MPGTHKKGTNDADGNGEKGGSLPEAPVVVEPKPAAKEPAKARDFGKEIDELKDLMRRNGWTVKG